MYMYTEKTLNLYSFIGVQAHTAHVHLRTQEAQEAQKAQEAQPYSAIKPAANGLCLVPVGVKSGMFIESGTNGTSF